MRNQYALRNSDVTHYHILSETVKTIASWSGQNQMQVTELVPHVIVAQRVVINVKEMIVSGQRLEHRKM